MSRTRQRDPVHRPLCHGNLRAFADRNPLTPSVTAVSGDAFQSVLTRAVPDA
jgi:hypothetical protein